MGARALVEANFFQNVPKALSTDYGSGDGFITEKSNFYMNSFAKTYTMGTDWTPPYRYSPELADDVPASVLECAGPSANIVF
jgi:pectate lyase